MELGLTFPLQRFLHQKPPPYGAEADRRFCRDLHVIQLRDRKCLLAVHCHSRYTFVRFDAPGLLWADLPVLFRAWLMDNLSAAGFGPAQIEAYLQTAGEEWITRTHRRREVAFLNRTWGGGCAGARYLAGHGPLRVAHAGLGWLTPAPVDVWALKDWLPQWSVSAHR